MMDRFKSILRKAVTHKCAKIEIVEHQSIKYYDKNGLMAITENQQEDRTWIESILNFLYQKDPNIHSGEPTKGLLNIPQLGKLETIGMKNDIYLVYLYFPEDGAQYFQSDWHELNNPKDIIDSISLEPDNEMVEQDKLDVDPPEEEQSELSSEHFFSAPSKNIDISDLPAPPLNISFSNQNFQDSEQQSNEDNTPTMQNNIVTQHDAIDLFAIPKTSNFQPQSDSAINSGEKPSASQEESIIADTVNLFKIPAFFSDPPAPVTEEVHESKNAITEIIPTFQVTPPSPIQEAPIQFAAPAAPSIKPEYHPPIADDAYEINFASNTPIAKSDAHIEAKINQILRDMIARKSSDLHLTIGQPIIFRIDGSIQRMQTDYLTPATMESLLLPIIPAPNKKEFATTSDTDFAYEIPNVGRFRVNIFRDNLGVGAVMRHIPSRVLTAEQLGLPKVMLDLCQLSKGLVLVTGPTGSGKSTTLAAMIDYINKTRADHLLTIEDPIEFVHQQQKCLINQREVGKHTKSFAKALKAALREDPDIVLIGEMRDLETIHIAIETAETGHLVFGTLHTTTAVSTIDRIIDQFSSDQQSQIRMMLASSLKGVIAQTLLPKIGGGRVAAHEILIPNDAVANMIREKKNHMIENHMQTQKLEGNQLLNESLLNHVLNKTVNFDDAYIKSVDKKSFVEMAIKKGIKVKNAPQPAVGKAS